MSDDDVEYASLLKHVNTPRSTVSINQPSDQTFSRRFIVLLSLWTLLLVGWTGYNTLFLQSTDRSTASHHSILSSNNPVDRISPQQSHLHGFTSQEPTHKQHITNDAYEHVDPSFKPSVDQITDRSQCPLANCSYSISGDIYACCLHHYPHLIKQSPGQPNKRSLNHALHPSIDESLPSFNLCPLPHDQWPFELNTEGDLRGGKYKNTYPFMHIQDSVKSSRDPRSSHQPINQPVGQLNHRFTVLETRYSYTEGMFSILAFLIENNLALYQASTQRTYWREEQYRNYIDQLVNRLTCRFWVEESSNQSNNQGGHWIVVPMDATYVKGDNGFSFRCPWPYHPVKPTINQSIKFHMIIDYLYDGPLLTPLDDQTFNQTTKQSNNPPVTLDLCPIHRPVIDFALCIKGLQGPNIEHHATETILYHQSINFERYLVFDDDGTHARSFDRLIESNYSIDVIHSPLFFGAQQLNFLQNSQYEICRYRLWYSARQIAFLDTDEFIVFNQASLRSIRLSGIPFNLNDDSKAISLDPSIDQSIESINQFAVALQNVPSYRSSWIAGVRLEQCTAEHVDEKYAHSNEVFQSIRFRTCNRYYEHGKWWARPYDSCHTGNHEPDCEGQHATVAFTRMDQAMMVHYRAALSDRAQRLGGDVAITITGVKDAIEKQAKQTNITIAKEQWG